MFMLIIKAMKIRAIQIFYHYFYENYNSNVNFNSYLFIKRTIFNAIYTY